MDRTITRRGSYSGFLRHMLVHRAPWRVVFLPLVALGVLGYLLRLCDRADLKSLALALLVGRRIDEAMLAPLIDSYAAHLCAKNIYPQALQSIATDRAAGYRICLATASLRLYVVAIAKRLNITDVIATDLLADSMGRKYATIDGANCYGADKLVMICAWMAAQNLPRRACYIRAYSDHISDLPMLEFADERVATTPSARLYRYATERGWTITDWRKHSL